MWNVSESGDDSFFVYGNIQAKVNLIMLTLPAFVLPIRGIINRLQRLFTHLHIACC